MHSRIYQISRKPISKEDYITEDRYYDSFVGRIADYVSEDTSRENDLIWLTESLSGAAAIEGDKLTIVNKKAFFEPRFRRWKSQLSKMSELTLEQFAGMEEIKDSDGSGETLGFIHYMCEEAFNDTSEFYMDDNDEYFGWLTLTNFMREAKDGDVWYLGETFDYHM